MEKEQREKLKDVLNEIITYIDTYGGKKDELRRLVKEAFAEPVALPEQKTCKNCIKEAVELANNISPEQKQKLEDCGCDLTRPMTPGEAEIAKDLGEYLDKELGETEYKHCWDKSQELREDHSDCATCCYCDVSFQSTQKEAYDLDSGEEVEMEELSKIETLQLKKWFEQNCLDGDEVQGGQMMSSWACLEVITEVYRKGRNDERETWKEHDERIRAEFKKTLLEKLPTDRHEMTIEQIKALLS